MEDFGSMWSGIVGLFDGLVYNWLSKGYHRIIPDMFFFIRVWRMMLVRPPGFNVAEENAITHTAMRV